MTIRIAITGPDGAGKSSVCEALRQRLPDAHLRYGGKNRAHLLPTTAPGLSLWKHLRTLGRGPGLIGQYALFYPLEYLEQLARHHASDPAPARIRIYDRHPIDRMVLVHALQRKARHASRAPSAGDRFEHLASRFWHTLYRYGFPRSHHVFILLPSPALCFERSGGQYRTLQDAEDRVGAYHDFANTMSNDPGYSSLPVRPDTSIDTLCDQIVDTLTRQSTLPIP